MATNIYRDLEDVLKRRPGVNQGTLARVDSFFDGVKRVQPRWHLIPHWATHWAVNPNGDAYWFEQAPLLKGDRWVPLFTTHLDQTNYPLPLGYDWRMSLTERPEGV